MPTHRRRADSSLISAPFLPDYLKRGIARLGGGSLLLAAFFAGVAGIPRLLAQTPPAFSENFSGDPRTSGRFVELTVGTESSFGWNASRGELSAVLDLDASPAYWLSQPFAPITEATSVSFSARFRVDAIDPRNTPVAFVGLFTTNHVNAFGDGLSFVLSPSGTEVALTANVDQGDYRASGTTLSLLPGIDYQAIGRYDADRREFSVAIFSGTGFTNLIDVSSAPLLAGRNLRVDRIGLQNEGARNFDLTEGSITLSLDDLRIPAGGPPLLVLSPQDIVEGPGPSRTLVLPVSLSAPSDQEVTVNFATADGTAIAGQDFVAASGTLHFPRGLMTTNLTLVILGDAVPELDEEFQVLWSQPHGVSLSTAQTVVRIRNDDTGSLPGELDHFEWEPIASPQGVNQPIAVVVRAKDALGQTVESYTGSVDLDRTKVAEDRVAGTGGSAWNYPLAGTSQDARTQVIYPGSVVGGAGKITGLSLYVTLTPGRTLAGWTIRMKKTTTGQYSATSGWENSGWTTVYRRNETISGTGWVKFVFTNPFEWDGSGNLLLDFSFNTTTTGRDGQVRSITTTAPRSLVGVSASANGDPQGWAARTPVPTVVNRAPEVKFEVEREVAMEPERSGTFSQGEWQGLLVVKEMVKEMWVEANDGQGHVGRSNPFEVGVVGDLGVSLEVSGELVRLGQPFEYLARVTNGGLTAVEGVVLRDRLGPEVEYAQVQASQGNGCRLEDRDVVCELGRLEGGASATVTIGVTALAQGVVTNRAVVSGSAKDPNETNNRASVTKVVEVAQMGIRDTSVREGDSGEAELVYEVRLGPTDREVTVKYATVDGTAKAGEDYVATSGMLVFGPEARTNYVRVNVKGDVLREEAETVRVRLSEPVNATFARGEGIGTIEDDDQDEALPCIAVKDARVIEGDDGVSLAVFGLELSRVSGQVVSVNYQLVDGTAVAGQDYEGPLASTVSFTPGQTLAELRVPVLGDREKEGDEQFQVKWSGAKNGNFCGGATELVSVGVIENDDGLPGELDHFEWEPITSPQGVNQSIPVVVRAKDALGQTVGNYSGSVDLNRSTVLEERIAGTGGSAWNYPLAGTSQDARAQVIYLGNLVGGPGKITGLSLFVTLTPGRTLAGWTIRMKKTTTGQYSATSGWENTGWTTVYRRNETISGTGWVKFVFTTPYAWDGTGNLLVDFSFNTTTTGRDGQVRSITTTAPRSLVGVSASANGDPQGWAARTPVPTVVNRAPEVKFEVEREVAMEPERSGTFSQGEWQGLLVVKEMVKEMWVEANDGQGHVGRSNPFEVGVVGDLGVSLEVSGELVRLGQPFEYLARITNAGLTAVEGVVLRDRLGPEVEYAQVQASQGNGCRLEDRDVVCELGRLEGGASATVMIGVTAMAQGVVTNRAVVSGSAKDPNETNNRASVTKVVEVAQMAIRDTSVREGDSGEVELVYEVRLGPTDREVTVKYGTVDGTAKAGEDYVATSGTLVFGPEARTNYVRVNVKGDVLREEAETVRVRLSEPVNATFARGEGIGTIEDDDQDEALPCIAVKDARVIEGDDGVSLAVFGLELSRVSGQVVSVNYQLVDGTAVAGQDYEGPLASTVSFTPGQTLAELRVPVLGDREKEGDEQFQVKWSGAKNGTLCGGATELSTLGVIENNDGLPGELDHFEWEPIASPQGVNQPIAVVVRAKDALGQTVESYTGSVDLDRTKVAEDRVAGTGGSAWNYPLAGTSQDARTQVIYPGSVVGGAGKITGLSLYVTLTPGRTLAGWTIRMKKTTTGQYSATSGWENTGWTTVYRRNETISGTGWVKFVFTTPYAWDGTGNLLVDFSFNTTTTGRDGQVRAITTTAGRSLVGVSASANGDPQGWVARTPVPTVANRAPEVKFEVEREVAMEPERSGGFVKGEWQGLLVVKELVKEMWVEANDGQGHVGRSNPFEVGVVGDLGVSLEVSGELVRLGQPFEYLARVTNGGLTAVEGVVLRDRLGPEVEYAQVQASQGNGCRLEDRDVVCELGRLEGGASATVTIGVTALAQGVVTNRAVVSGSAKDPNETNNRASVTKVVEVAQMGIRDTSVREGDSGEAELVYEVRLGPTDREVTVKYATVDGTAKAGEDYVATSGMLVFGPEARTNYVRVKVKGDVLREEAETVRVRLSEPVNATFARGEGIGTIEDDDQDEALPCIAVKDARVVEGDDGISSATFLLQMSRVSGQFVTVNYQLADRTAVAGQDYEFLSPGTVSFAPGQTEAELRVRVIGDREKEGDEQFQVKWSGAKNGIFCGGATELVSVGVIENDDGLPGELDHFEWEPITSPQGVNQPIPVVVRAKDALGQTVGNYSGSVDLNRSTVLEERIAGTGGSAWNYPLAGTSQDARAQVIYPGNLVGGPGKITGLSLFVNLTPGRTLAGWTLRMKKTTTSQYSATSGWENTGWTTVYRRNETISGTGWVKFVFTTPYAWDGTGNLLVDFSFNTTTTGRDGQVRSITTTAPRALVGGSASANGDPQGWVARTPVPTVANRAPEVKFEVEREVAMEPERSGTFSQGEWQGLLVVKEMVKEMWVEANDGQGHVGRSNPFEVGVVGDLGVSLEVSGELVRLGQPFEYLARVTNGGLTAVEGVVLRDRLGPEVEYAQVQASQGNGCRLEDRDVVCELGTVPGGASATVMIGVTAMAQGVVTNRAVVSGSAKDPNETNNRASVTKVVEVAQMGIRDTSVREGDSGEVELVYEVRLGPTDREVRVKYGTVDGTAKAGEDYVATSGTLVFGPEARTNYVRVQVKGDVRPEPNETFTLTLSNPIGAELARGSASGTIENDDLPGLSVAPAFQSEGDEGMRPMIFRAELGEPASQPVTVRYRTVDGSARAGADYAAAEGLLRFDPGVVAQDIAVPILGDRVHEDDETFRIELLSPTGAALGKSTAEGTILNDDLPGITITDTTVNVAFPDSTNAILKVQSSFPSLQRITLEYFTLNGTATAGTDYESRTNGAEIIVLEPGQTEASIRIPVNQNTIDETNETFHVILAHPVHARLDDEDGLVTIIFRPIQSSPPTISAIPNQRTRQDRPTGAIAFEVRDAETPADRLFVQAVPSDTVLLPKDRVLLSGASNRRFLVLDPAPGKSGTTTVRVTVTDEGGLSAGTTFQLVVEPPRPPQVSLVAPRSGAVFSPGQPLEIVANATDADGQVVRVELFHARPGGADLRLDNILTPPYVASFQPDPSAEEASFYARATDDSGLTALSETVTVRFLGGDILIIRTANHPEIDQVHTWLSPESGFQVLERTQYTWRDPVVQVIDRAQIYAELLANFRVVIWDEPGGPAHAMSGDEVRALVGAWKSGASLYLLGDHLAVRPVGLDPLTLRAWEDLLALNPGNVAVGPGLFTGVEPRFRPTELLTGPWGEVLDFAYPRAITAGRFRDDAEVRATLGSAPVLVRLPAFDTFENPFEGRRLIQSLSLAGLAGASGTLAEESARTLLRNGVQWLMRGECDNFSASLQGVSSLILEKCRPTLLSAVVDNNGRCATGGLVVTNLLSDGLRLLGARMRYENGAEFPGPIHFLNQQVVFGIGQLSNDARVVLETWVATDQSGVHDSTYVRRVNYRPLEWYSTEVVVDSTCACPRLDWDAEGLLVRGGCPVETIVETSETLQTWVSQSTNSPIAERDFRRVPTEDSGRPVQIYRLMVPLKPSPEN